MDARIGKLIRNGQEVYYTFLEGYGKGAFEGTLEAVEAALGIRPTPMRIKTPVEPVRTFKTYCVTVTPKYKSYGTGWDSNPYTVDVIAYDRGDAIKQARSEYNDNAAYPGDVATYTAKQNKSK